MISHLGWVNHDSNCDSDSSEDSLTAADLAVLEDHELLSSREDDPSDSHSPQSCSSDYDSDSDSAIAPPFSPVMTKPFQDTLSDVLQDAPSQSDDGSTSLDASTAMPLFSVDANQPAIGNGVNQLDTLVEQLIPHDVGNDVLEPLNPVIAETPTEGLASHTEEDTSQGSTTWNGFKLVGDNIDKNYRQSLHRVDKKTTSIHYFHHYAMRDCVDFSGCSETLPTNPIDVEKFIINMDDLAKLHDVVLMSRYKACIARVFSLCLL